eukprot:CAMPEP_0116822888 /NCGR_PEP_ID=MMETSP0418-20121206/526_1 /TAXON_ID=1158023 /ORGANISM="Astrosyne radiata, Strain 13vi08-1A" /LENGTH=114 /DNA_ID=CAMNT_0004451067 /DNA_START=380 /DNA_END=721 /DNA_ORIENTATION=-
MVDDDRAGGNVAVRRNSAGRDAAGRNSVGGLAGDTALLLATGFDAGLAAGFDAGLVTGVTIGLVITSVTRLADDLAAPGSLVDGFVADVVDGLTVEEFGFEDGGVAFWGTPSLV